MERSYPSYGRENIIQPRVLGHDQSHIQSSPEDEGRDGYQRRVQVSEEIAFVVGSLPELRSLRVGACCRHGKIQEPTAKDRCMAMPKQKIVRQRQLLASSRVPVPDRFQRSGAHGFLKSWDEVPQSRCTLLPPIAPLESCHEVAFHPYWENLHAATLSPPFVRPVSACSFRFFKSSRFVPAGACSAES
jgi:hypothetical protein